MFDIEKCIMCIRENTKLTGSCSMKYFHDQLCFKQNKEKCIKNTTQWLIHNTGKTDTLLHYEKTIQEYFPEYIKLYNTIILLC